MEDNKKSPKTAIILTIVIGIGVIIASIVYNRVNSIEEWLVCNYTGDIVGYEETIKFRFMYDQMYGYYEERNILTPSEQDRDSLLKEMNDFGKDFQKSEELEYTVTNEGLRVKSKLYLKTIAYTDFFNEYFQESNITVSSKINEVEAVFKDNYKCKRTRI